MPRNANGTRPVAVGRAQTYPTQQVPAPIQTQHRQPTAPVEPYLNSPIAGGSGVPLNIDSPILARHDSAPFDRRDTTNQQQQQALLALFKKPSIPSLKPVAAEDKQEEPAVKSPTAARLAAAANKFTSSTLPPMKTGGVGLGEGSNRPQSQPNNGQAVPGGANAFAKDAFLIAYLEQVAKGAGQ